jgi:hypothetical protein
MAEKQASRKSQQPKEEDDNSAPPQRSEKEKKKEKEKEERAKKTSAITEDVIQDIDRALREQCDLPQDGDVSAEEFEKRAAKLMKEYVQKGGQ